MHLHGDMAFYFGNLERRVKAANIAEQSIVKLSTPAEQILTS